MRGKPSTLDATTIFRKGKNREAGQSKDVGRNKKSFRSRKALITFEDGETRLMVSTGFFTRPPVTLHSLSQAGRELRVVHPLNRREDMSDKGWRGRRVCRDSRRASSYFNAYTFFRCLCFLVG